MPKAPTRVELGTQYCDIVTGFVGTATSRMTTKNGCVQVHLKPKLGLDRSAMPKGEWVFETQLAEFVPGSDAPTVATINSKVDKDVLKLLNKRYRATTTGFTGLATAHTESLNGHAQLLIEASIKPDGAMGEAWGIDLQDLVESETAKKVDAPTPPRGPRPEQFR